MTTEKISAGILAPSVEVSNRLAGLISATNLASIMVSVNRYCAMEDDHPTQRFIEARPDIIFVDMEDQRAALAALITLHAVLPATWLCVFARSADPHLIIETMQAGAREFLTEPLSTPSLAKACTRFLDEKKRQHRDSKSRGKIYSITSGKGGSGATSIAVNMAVTLAELPGTSVAILDLNCPMGDAAAYLNLKPQFSISDALAVVSRLDPALLETLMTKAARVSLLPGPEQIKKGPSLQLGSLANLLRVISKTYTHTFIDVPCVPNPELLQATADVSDAVLVVTTPELPSVWRTRRLLALMAGSKCCDRLRVILNRDGSRDDLSKKEIARALNHPIYWRLPNDYGAGIRALDEGRAVVESNYSRLAASYRELTHDLTGIVPSQNRGSLVGFFFGSECLELKGSV